MPETASFAFTEVRIGVAPAVISLPLLPRTDPRALARYYLTGERFDAPEAVRTGLLTEAGDDVEDAVRRHSGESSKIAERFLKLRRRIIKRC